MAAVWDDEAAIVARPGARLAVIGKQQVGARSSMARLIASRSPGSSNSSVASIRTGFLDAQLQDGRAASQARTGSGVAGWESSPTTAGGTITAPNSSGRMPMCPTRTWILSGLASETTIIAVPVLPVGGIAARHRRPIGLKVLKGIVHRDAAARQPILGLDGGLKPKQFGNLAGRKLGGPISLNGKRLQRGPVQVVAKELAGGRAQSRMEMLEGHHGRYSGMPFYRSPVGGPW